jgi:hypothetical protein
VEVVGVYQQDPTWLMIHPPLGSFSWINGRFMSETKENNKIGLVHAPDDTPVPVLAGSTEYTQEPSVEVAKLPRGSLVTILGSSRPTDKGPLVPVAPTAREVRYIKASEVQKVDFPGTTPDPRAKEAAAKVAQAEQAVRDARKHLEDAHNITTDPGQRQDIQKKLAWLPVVPPAPGTNTTGTPNTTQVGTVYHAAAASDANKVQNANLTAAVPATQAKWSQWGKLRKATFNSKEGQPMYVLTAQNGEPLVYAVADTGKTLEPHVGRYVCLYGVPNARSDVVPGVDVMRVSHVGSP